jgi:RNA polymerase sigma factor (sigma-70 family)
VIVDKLAPLVKLFDDNVPWAKLVAARVHRKVPPCFELSDLEQEATLAMWKQCQRYDPFNEKGTPFQAFAYLAVRGACLMSVRRRAWRESQHQQLGGSMAGFSTAANEYKEDRRLKENWIADTRPTPEAEAIDSQMEARESRQIDRQREWLAEEIDKLPPGDKYLFESHHIEGVEIDKIARVVGIPRVQIGRRVASVLKRLKEENAA